MAVVLSTSDSSIEEKLNECLRFIDFFKRSYVLEGSTSPPFHEGLLTDAICLAWNKPAANIKMLALYMHHEQTSHSATFAKHLTSAHVLRILKEYCVLWGWDVTSPHNWHLACEMIADNFGIVSSDAFQELEEWNFPCMLLLTRGKEGIDLVQYVRKSPYKFNILTALFRAVDTFSCQIRQDLIAKESSKKQKSLFCGGSWTKVTEAMAIDANMATYKFADAAYINEDQTIPDISEEQMNSIPSINQTQLPGIVLQEILKVRPIVFEETSIESQTPKASSDLVSINESNKLGKFQIVNQLMQEEIASKQEEGAKNANNDLCSTNV